MKKILVGMSGGVDSSAAALLLLRQGYDVTGMTLLLTPEAGPDGKEPSDARTVCEALGIEHYTVDMKREFKQHVVDYFTGEYIDGRTPNPCVECNKNIKFGAMLDWALERGFDGIATGHYARVQESTAAGRKEYTIVKAQSSKDQSYVLWQLEQRQLAHVVFPVCDIEKPVLRELVRQENLPVYSKKDSQDICFIPDKDYVSFIRASLSDEISRPDTRAGVAFRPGSFVGTDGSAIGRHNGYIHYTTGQRKGLGGGFSQPMFVLGIRPEGRQVVLGTDSQCFTGGLTCSRINIIQPERDGMEFEAQVKIRYGARAAHARVKLSEDRKTASVKFTEPQRAVTPGQSAVFYDGDRLIGGGVID